VHVVTGQWICGRESDALLTVLSSADLSEVVDNSRAIIWLPNFDSSAVCRFISSLISLNTCVSRDEDECNFADA
jgi:hypothetical protein